ncbi:hypothetical protein CAG54_03395 [Vibrio sp. V27_P1S3P104]|uniref:TetR/AcrR family transcriptional regulator C-terminal domain-containing protein n=1 Tax=unclassified Vibrio TaxID=2614977 RepID=UPI0013729328|nr:hypothetical protein [Vibrio sp. V28_P6S34P95]NAX05178.1 hypothetical protein [Vibrio sp. V30_P3S12P165]NAX33146.1 hypothetical protein [Vibrio sp. V29_P1S30P107]NAX36566.1 hypothetical protein [Vibrio sp. V27_P1S3P104]NAX40431.1 hypothetical protein [Vibrio sp. V26_P1S5P106]
MPSSIAQLTAKYLSIVDGSDVVLQQWIIDAMEDGRIRHGESKLIAMMMISQFHGCFLWPQLIANYELPDATSQIKLLDEITRVFLCAYAVNESHEKGI